MTAPGARLRRRLATSPILARLAPFKQPPILLLSYPRSGSSWVGSVLATSPGVAYLREPVNQPWLKQRGGRYTLLDLDEDAAARRAYEELGDDAFRGTPPADPQIIPHPEQLSPFGRHRRRLLIKEVNPRALGFYRARYAPSTILLLRHPAGVAASFRRLGWLDAADTQRATDDPDATVWEKFGNAFGSIMQEAVGRATSDQACTVIRYETLAHDPEREFRELFERLELPLPADYAGVIERYCHANEPVRHRHQTRRASRPTADRWRSELSAEELRGLRRGVSLSGFESYAEDEAWGREG